MPRATPRTRSRPHAHTGAESCDPQRSLARPPMIPRRHPPPYRCPAYCQSPTHGRGTAHDRCCLRPAAAVARVASGPVFMCRTSEAYPIGYRTGAHSKTRTRAHEGKESAPESWHLRRGRNFESCVMRSLQSTCQRTDSLDFGDMTQDSDV